MYYNEIIYNIFPQGKHKGGGAAEEEAGEQDVRARVQVQAPQGRRHTQGEDGEPQKSEQVRLSTFDISTGVASVVIVNYILHIIYA